MPSTVRLDFSALVVLNFRDGGFDFWTLLEPLQAWVAAEGGAYAVQVDHHRYRLFLTFTNSRVAERCADVWGGVVVSGP